MAVERERALANELLDVIRTLQVNLLELGYEESAVLPNQQRFPNLYKLIEKRIQREEQERWRQHQEQEQEETAKQTGRETDVFSVQTARPRAMDMRTVSPAKSVADLHSTMNTADLYIEGPTGTDTSAVNSLKEMLRAERRR